MSHLVNNSVLLVKTKTQTEETTLFLRKYLNCLDQDDPKLAEALKEHYIRKRNNEQLYIDSLSDIHTRVLNKF